MPLPPASNINDPILSSYDYRPIGSPIAKETVESKLDLNSLRFSIEDFQKLSTGKYNAGNLVLTDKGKLDIANHHRHFTVLNSVKSRAADSLAIRAAFADALENAGVSEERMAVVRRRLGLGVDSSVKGAVSILPLSRQEVREIIDANIDEINGGRGAGRRLRTQEQLQARLGDATKAKRERIRQSVNEASNLGNKIDFDQDFGYTVDFLVRKNYSKIPVGDLNDMLEFAEEFDSALILLEDPDMKLDWARENGDALRFERVSNTISVALDEDGDVLVRLETPTKRMTFPLGKGPAGAHQLVAEARKRINQALRKAEAEKTAAAADATYKKVPGQVAEAAVNHAVDTLRKLKRDVPEATERGCMPIHPTPENLTQAARLVAKYGAGSTEKGLRLLAAYALNAVCLFDDPEEADAVVKRVARDIAGFREFRAGDPRFAAVEAKLLDYARGVVEDELRPEKNDRFDADGIAEQLVKDANRSTYVFNGKSFALGRNESPQPVVDALKAAVKPEHRKAVSAIMNQFIDNLLENPSQNLPFQPTSRHPERLDLVGTPGLDMFIRTGPNDDFFYSGGPADACLGGRYALEVAEDGKSAKFTLTSKGILRFGISESASGMNNPLGTFTRTLEMKLDLSGDDVKIADLHVSQSFDA